MRPAIIPVDDLSISANARHVRWEQLMAENKGKIDVAAAQRFLADHYDTFSHETAPSERTLCGHIDLSTRGSSPWQPPFGPAGTVQNKAADATMLAQMSFTAAMGHADGIDFKAAAAPEGTSAVRVGKKRAARSRFATLDHVPNRPVDFGIGPSCDIQGAPSHQGYATLPVKTWPRKERSVDYRVFLSHAYKDRWIAKQCARLIEETDRPHVRVFFDEKDVEGGQSIPDSVRTGIEKVR